MNTIVALARRELGGMFSSLIGYVVLAIFLAFMGIPVAAFILSPGQATDMRQMFAWSHIALIFVIPLLTMSVLADEYNSGRIEMLRTSPITEFQILAGKFLGTLAFCWLLVAATLVFVGIILIYGRPDFGAVLASYFGLLLMCMLFVAIGLFFSACTRYQVIAALLSMITLFTIGILMDLVVSFVLGFLIPISNGFLRYTKEVLSYATFRPHMEQFAKGVVNTSDVVYFLTGTFLFLFLTYFLLESRKWR